MHILYRIYHNVYNNILLDRIYIYKYRIYRNTHEFIMEDPYVQLHSHPVTFCESTTVQGNQLHKFEWEYCK